MSRPVLMFQLFLHGCFHNKHPNSSFIGLRNQGSLIIYLWVKYKAAFLGKSELELKLTSFIVKCDCVSGF